jgi:acyl-coenzyme A thioesterase PaaI-like protein
MNASRALQLWQTLSSKPGGKWWFSKLVCWQAPYFASIAPKFVALRSGYCEVHVKKRRAVLNHIGTVHAIAMCNMAELAAGCATDATIPETHRWIPKAMSVQYLKKAETDLRAVVRIASLPPFEQPTELPVTVNVLDRNEQEVFRAIITMWVTAR